MEKNNRKSGYILAEAIISIGLFGLLILISVFAIYSISLQMEEVQMRWSAYEMVEEVCEGGKCADDEKISIVETEVNLSESLVEKTVKAIDSEGKVYAKLVKVEEK